MTNPRPNWNTAFRLGYEDFWSILAAVMENDTMDNEYRIKELEWEARALETTVENMKARIEALEADKNEYYEQSKKAWEALGDEVDNRVELEAELEVTNERLQNEVEDLTAVVKDLETVNERHLDSISHLMKTRKDLEAELHAANNRTMEAVKDAEGMGI